MENSTHGSDVSVSPWERCDGVPPLGADVHVWRAHVPSFSDRMPALGSVLRPEERERAGRFRQPEDRDRYTLSQGLLRILSGAYLGMAPEAAPIVYGANGKPALAKHASALDLRFNASHSGNRVLVAFSAGREIGVDIEQVDPRRADEQLVRHFFSPGEVADWLGLPPTLRTEAFFRCWTRKEAFLKAKGTGLSLPLEQFRVSLLPDAPAALLEVGWDPAEAGRWFLADLHSDGEYAAALACEGAPCNVRCWDVSCNQLDGI